MIRTEQRREKNLIEFINGHFIFELPKQLQLVDFPFVIVVIPFLCIIQYLL